MGTPITGSIVCAAITPARCAAAPAPAIITSTPFFSAPFASLTALSGERCADAIVVSKEIPNAFNIFSVSSITGKSESLPIIIRTFGFICPPLSHDTRYMIQDSG